MSPRVWTRDLALGAKLSVAGGRSGWARLAMISAGMGLGVAMLLLAATLPTVISARDGRTNARAVAGDQEVPPGADTLLALDVKSEYRGEAIYGQMLQAEGERAPRPPGVSRNPGPGEMVVSPALARLLASDEGAVLRGRWSERVVGTIGVEGLAGPEEYAYYVGSERLAGYVGARRIRSFGRADLEQGLPPALLLLGAVGLVVLLLPVAIFVTTAVRFGGEARDRQLAAIRLVGADAATTRRVAAGETLTGALFGLLTGALLYLAVGLLVSEFVPPGWSFGRADLRPVPALAVLVVVLVPIASVVVTLTAMRRVVVEPLGVVRRSDQRRRRLWWRLVVPLAGLAMLFPVRRGLEGQPSGYEFLLMAGVAALLTGVALLLPWLVEATVHRLGGGGVAWQLAIRRLQLDSGTAVRSVSGIVVSVAGAIALQGVLAAVQAQYTTELGDRADHFQLHVMPRIERIKPDGPAIAQLRLAPGVREVATETSLWAKGEAAASDTKVIVGECAVLRLYGKLGACDDGNTFVVVDRNSTRTLNPGSTYQLSGHGEADQSHAATWTLPATARTVAASDGPLGSWGEQILVTPAAAGGIRLADGDTDVYIAVDSTAPDAAEQVRNAVTRADPTAWVTPIRSVTIEAVLTTVRQALLVGAAALLVLIGASMLVNVVEQLRERRRLLAVLIAFGTRRSTLSGSVLYQVAIPVLLGLALAVATGSGLGAVLQTAANSPVRFDWLGIGAATGAAAVVVLLTTAASLPLLWRLTSPGGLRSE